MNYISNAYYDKGQRKNNEDSILLYELDIGGYSLLLMAVLDGIGSLSEGEKASGYILECISEMFLSFANDGKSKRISLHNIEGVLENTLYECVSRMQDYSRIKGLNLGATLSLCIIYKNRYFTAQLGDSAIFLVGKSNIRRISSMHTNEDGSINKCVGNIGYFSPDYTYGRIRRGMGILVASDGFYKKATDELDILRHGEIDGETTIGKRLSQIGELVRKKGEKDNASALYAVRIN